MWEGILDRMVARAMPPNLTDPDHERIAAEAAENAIRQTAWLAGIAGILLLVLAGTMLYRYLPVQQISQARSESSKVVSELAAEESKLHQTNDNLQQKLDDVTKEFQGKVSALEGQVAELRTKLETAKAPSATGQAPTEVSKPAPRLPGQKAGLAKTRVPAAFLGLYQCGNGRSVRNPAQCRDTESPAASEVDATPPGLYQCGDGRTARDPAECKATVSPLEP
jgi:hypothetical protein